MRIHDIILIILKALLNATQGGLFTRRNTALCTLVNVRECLGLIGKKAPFAHECGFMISSRDATGQCSMPPKEVFSQGSVQNTVFCPLRKWLGFLNANCNTKVGQYPCCGLRFTHTNREFREELICFTK